MDKQVKNEIKQKNTSETWFLIQKFHLHLLTALTCSSWSKPLRLEIATWTEDLFRLTDCKGVEKGDEQKTSEKITTEAKWHFQNHYLHNLGVWIGQSQSCLPSFWSWRLMTSSAFKRRFLGNSSPDAMGQTCLFKSDCLFRCSFATQKIEILKQKHGKTTKTSIIRWYNMMIQHDTLRFIMIQWSLHIHFILAICFMVIRGLLISTSIQWVQDHPFGSIARPMQSGSGSRNTPLARLRG